MTNTYRCESGFGIGCWVEGSTSVDSKLNRDTIDCLSQTTDGNVDVKGISGVGTRGNEYCSGNQEEGCCYIAAKPNQTKANNLSELSPTVLWKMNLDLVSNEVEELGRPSVVGIASSFLLGKRSLRRVGRGREDNRIYET